MVLHGTIAPLTVVSLQPQQPSVWMLNVTRRTSFLFGAVCVAALAAILPSDDRANHSDRVTWTPGELVFSVARDSMVQRSAVVTSDESVSIVPRIESRFAHLIEVDAPGDLESGKPAVVTIRVKGIPATVGSFTTALFLTTARGELPDSLPLYISIVGTRPARIGTIFPPLPANAVVESSETIGDARTANFSLTMVSLPEGDAVWLGRIVERGVNRVWEVVDELVLPVLPAGQELVIGRCGHRSLRLPETIEIDPEILAIVMNTPGILSPSTSSWRADRTAERINPIVTGDIACHRQ
jgi:hypothetical protein